MYSWPQQVMAKLYLLERSFGSLKCNGKCCQVCMKVTGSNTFSSSVYKKSMLLIIVLTAMTNALYVCSLVVSTKCNMDIITKITIGNALKRKHVCNSNYLNISEVRVRVVFLMTSRLFLLIKLIPKILTNGNTTGIPLKNDT